MRGVIMDVNRCLKKVLKYGVIYCICILAVAYFRIRPYTTERREAAKSEYNTAFLNYESALADYEDAIEDYQKRAKQFETTSIIDYNKNISRKYDLGESIEMRATISYKLIRNGGIGNDFSYSANINGSSLSNRTQVKINLFRNNTFQIAITEHDPSIDDVGEEAGTFLFPLDRLNEGTTNSYTIYVRETRGRGAGESAEFNVTLTLDPVRKIDLTSDYYVKPKFTESRPARPTEPILPNEKDFTISDIFANDATFHTICVILALIFLVRIVLFVRHEIIEARREQERLRKMEQEKEQREIERAEFIKELSGQSIRDFCKVPTNISFTQDNLPKDNNNRIYGSYTVYISRSGTKYHRKCGCSSANIPYHLFRVQSKGYAPCARCCPPNGDLPQWYRDYIAMLEKANRLDVQS